MKREKIWIIGALLFGLVIQVILASQVSGTRLPEWTTTAYGSLIALGVLAIITLVNRVRLEKRKARGEFIDFKVFPIKALSYAVFCFLALAGAVLFPAFLADDYERNFGRYLGHVPILAVASAIYSTSYFSPKS